MADHSPHAPPPRDAPGRALRADCARCSGLCCVAPGFGASADFAIDKFPGEPCPHLLADSRCGIHSSLREKGFPGCAVYDCFGAGQQVTQVTFGGRDWREAPHLAARMFESFAIMRQLHELLWYLTEALQLQPGGALHDELRRAFDRTESAARGDADDIMATDAAAYRRDVGDVLLRVSDHVRSTVRGRPADLRGADLTGRDLAGADLRAANLGGAVLAEADLRGADLVTADLIGVDLSGADLSGADLSDCLFLTQSQLDGARGDLTTRVSTSLHHPSHWPAARAR